MMKKKKRINQTLINPHESIVKDYSPDVPQRSKFKGNLKIYNRKLNDKQKQFLELASNKDVSLVFVSGPAGTSKAQPLDSIILGENGWIKMGNIKVGDKIFGEDGNLWSVLSLHPQGEKEICKVSFSDGTFTECTEDHLWKTQTSNDRNQRRWLPTINGKRHREWTTSREGTTKTTSEIKDTLYVRQNRINHSIPITLPIKFKHQSHIISPYIMGFLLGDGCFRRKGNVTFTTSDESIILKMNKELPHEVKINKLPSAKYEYSIIHKKKSIAYNNGNLIKNEIIKLKLDMLKSENKFIPHEYLFDSIENRIELLRGLMDSDGHVCSKSSSVIFTTTSKNLANDIRFIVESLGGVCHVSIRENFYTYLEQKRQGLNSYSVCIAMHPSINPCWLERKSIKIIPKSKYVPTRYITNVEFIGRKECQCILVDNPSHLYLTNNFIVTHNTFLSIYHALNMINDKRVSDLIYIRSAVESSDAKIGFLPGEATDKLAPYIQPLLDKMAEMLPKSDIDILLKEERVSGVPVGFLRGLNWNAKVIIADEAQNMTFKELFTLITRTGEFSKVFILGDPEQSDINGKSGFVKMIGSFDDEESRQNGIHVFRFTEDDIVRSGLVRFIIKKVKKAL